jgi:hypothetical protein
MSGLSARWLVPGRVFIPNMYCIVLHCYHSAASAQQQQHHQCSTTLQQGMRYSQRPLQLASTPQHKPCSCVLCL